MRLTAQDSFSPPMLHLQINKATLSVATQAKSLLPQRLGVNQSPAP